MATEKRSVTTRSLLTTRAGLLLGFFALCLVTALLSRTFLTVTNIINILRQVSINGVLAVGMTLVIISGGIDLSVGSILAIVGAVVASMMVNGFVESIGLGIMLGAALGLVNGVVITRLRVPPFVATLGMMTIARGATLAFTRGYPIAPAKNSAFQYIGAGYLGPVPVPVIALLVVFLFFYWLLSDTRFGRHIYSVGSNSEASYLSGINIKRVWLIVYVISGLCSGIAAIVLTSRIYSAGPLAGNSYELDAIAAAVIGGSSLMGGVGNIPGTFIGVLILGVMNNSFNLLGIEAPYQQIFKGFIIILAVSLDMLSKRPAK